MMVSACSRRRSSRAFSARNRAFSGASGWKFDLRPRCFADSACSVPSSRCRRHVERCDEYSPSRRSRAPIAPSPRPSACSRIERLYSAANFLRTAFSATSGSGRAGLLGPSKASVTARSRTPARDPSGFRAAVRFTSWHRIHFTSTHVQSSAPSPFLLAGLRVDSPWISPKSGEHVDRLWTANSDRPQAAHINPPAAHTPPGHLGCRSFAITTTNLIDHQKPLLRNTNLHGERCLSHVGTEGLVALRELPSIDV